MTRRFFVNLALSIAIGLPVGYLLRDGYARTVYDPAHAMLSMFEERCLPMLTGESADISGLIDVPMTIHHHEYVDPKSHLSLLTNKGACSISDSFAPLDDANVQTLVMQLRERIPKLVGLPESDDMAPVGNVAVGWMKGERLSPERWGVSMIQFGAGGLRLSLHLPPKAHPSP
ncbi:MULTISPECIES: hypothetical protein [Thioclava]|uniref:hypothetical protein n=1 Tax=Thioclava TaxID=285107 RepID=UPI00099725E0|nr:MULTISPECIES: hypothetical protein [Thioclava]MAQ37275.1 hypothetical protein [Thioclava sp.]|tara:strand:- start:698 stop:1216 length:519 start_codon:yes stop_codon:yes gene_type:complete